MDERVVDVICGGDTDKNCSIRLGNITCDGYDRNTSIGVFSHFHDDHVKSMPICVSTYDVLITHNITFEGINALQPGMRYREQWVSQDYDTKYNFANGVIRLLKANHIPGSSQVHVESDGKTLLYSGDFSYPDVQIRNADYLVIDSTHGDPYMDGRTDRKSVKNRMFEYVEERIESNRQIVIKALSGTLQEIVRHFEIGYGRKMRDDIAFVMEKKQDAVLRNIYRDEREELRETTEYGSLDFWNLLNADKKCVIFTTRLDIPDDEIRNMHNILVDRFTFSKDELPIRPYDGGCRFNLAAHASINEIYKYIESVNPKHVVTDNSRSSYGRQLAKLIEQKFPHIKTEYRPTYAV